MSKNLISIKNLDVKYITNKKPVHAVKDVSFDIKKGEIFGLVGESGCGKSTVVQSIIRTLNPPAIITKGYIKYNNKDILSLSVSEVRKLRWSQISIVMQSALNALNPVLTIKEQIIDVFITHKGMSKFEAVEKSKDLLDLVDINDNRLESYAHELSGGMRQRVVLAIALALTPPLIIMDEPTTALDVIIEREILLKILELRKSLDFTILFITHDLNLLLEFADKIGVMKKGKLVEVDITKKIKMGGEKEYTKKLISSLPSASGKRGIEFFPEPNIPSKTGIPMLEMKNINKEYLIGGFFKKKTLHAVKDFSLRIFKGEIIGLVGESGSGKSTIAQLITRLETQTSGSILLNGNDLKRNRSKNVSLGYRKKVQMIFQDPFGSLNNIHNVYHHLSRPILRHNIVPKRKLEEYIYKLLESVELSPGELFARKFPHEMSGGERQRVAIARALSVKPDLVIADEPTSMLDVSIRMDILRILAKLRNEHNVAILFITHDLASARYLADRIIVLQNGEKIEQGISEDLIQSPKELYTKQLIAAASPGWLENAILEQ